jgi:hypothetical protein
MKVMNQNNVLRFIVCIALFMAQNIALADKRPAPELGRLFTQPETRAQLDLNRKIPRLSKNKSSQHNQRYLCQTQSPCKVM